MSKNGDIIFILQEFVSYGMIYVQMGVYDVFHAEFVPVDKIHNGIFFLTVGHARINYGTTSCVGVIHHVRIDAEDCKLKYSYFHNK